MDMENELSAAKRLWGVVGQAPGMAGAGEGERGNETGRGIWREDMDERKKERKGEFQAKVSGDFNLNSNSVFGLFITTLVQTDNPLSGTEHGEKSKTYLLDIRTALKVSPHSSIYTLRKVFDVTAVQSSHGNTAISGHVYVGLLSQRLRLRRRKSSETMASSQLSML